MWYRVFGSTDAPVDLDALLAHLLACGHDVQTRVGSDEQGWFTATLVLGGEHRYELQRYLAGEEGIRAELNAWAAVVELLDTPHQERLMLHLIGTRQLFTLRAVEGKA